MIDPLSLTVLGLLAKGGVAAKVAIPVAKGGAPAAKVAVSLGKFIISCVKGVGAGSTASANTGIATGKSAAAALGHLINEYNEHHCYPPGPTGIPGECPRIPV
jgi:hypothetical protein